MHRIGFKPFLLRKFVGLVTRQDLRRQDLREVRMKYGLRLHRSLESDFSYRLLLANGPNWRVLGCKLSVDRALLRRVTRLRLDFVVLENFLALVQDCGLRGLKLFAQLSAIGLRLLRLLGFVALTRWGGSLGF